MWRTLILTLFVGALLIGCSSKEQIVKKQVNYEQTYQHANKAWNELDKNN